MKTSYASVDDALAAAPAAALPLLRKLRSLARKAAPDAEERISYGMPAVFVDGRVLLYFAAFKTHVGVYPPPRGDAAFMKAIAPYAGPKGNLSFPLGEEIPDTLLKAILAARLAAVRDPAATKVKAQVATRAKAASRSGIPAAKAKGGKTAARSPATPGGKTSAKSAVRGIKATKAGRADSTTDPARKNPARHGAEGSFARRARWPMPALVERALKETGLQAAYDERPPYQRNDYVGWILHAKTPATKMKRLAQMLDELERGGVYMRMKHAASAKPRAA